MAALTDSSGTPNTTRLPSDPPTPRTTSRQKNDFAIIVPTNPQARKAFHEIAMMIRLDPEWNLHHRQFVEIIGDVAFSQVDSDTEASSAIPESILNGYFRLNVDLSPKFPNLGWLIGGGRQDLKDLGVDILLTLQKQKHQISGRHARIQHDATSGALMLHVDPKKKVTMNSETVNDGQRMFSSESTILVFGDLVYQLRFTGLGEAEYKDQLNSKRLESGIERLVAPLEATPTDRHFDYQGYSIQPPMAYGAHGIVSPCMQIKTGKGYAVKRVRRTENNLEDILTEIQVYETVQGHENVCNLIAALFSEGDRLMMGRSPINEVFFVMEPLSIDPLTLIIGSKVDSTVAVSAFIQSARGLSYIHSKGITHRDLKPANIMVSSYAPFRVVIIDYGHATFDKSSTDHMKGTLSYLAPEILHLKNPENTGKPYKQTCDLWSLGLVGYQVLLRKRCFWGSYMSSESYDRIISELKEGDLSACQSVLGLLHRIPENRLTLERLLSMPWPNLDLSISRPSL